MLDKKKLSYKTLLKSYINWAFFHLSSISFEKFQTYGLLHSMMPVIKELYGDNKEEELKALKRHGVVFNVEPVMGTIVPGIVAGLEENRANGADLDDTTINNIKVGLMGPMAGLGDAITQGLVWPLLLSIGISLSTDGSVIGPLFFIITCLAFNVGFSYSLFFRGYKLGIDSIKLFLGENSENIQKAFGVLGLIMLGAIGASYVNLTVNLEVAGISIQDFLDGLLPSLLPLLLLFGTWLLRKRTQIKPTVLILLIVAISIIGTLIGIF
jgi:D-glucosaminate-specific PTS system IID component